MINKPVSLYLCYQSLLEPLTQTQVVSYLEGLARGGFGIVLLTFEPVRLTDEQIEEWRERLSLKGITWHHLRYHKRPTLPATAWDVLAGIAVGLRLIRRYRIGLVHARAHVPGVMGLALKRLTGVKLLFDVRGLMAEEYADGGAWPVDGFLFRLTKRAERTIVRGTDAVVVLTHQVKDLFLTWYRDELLGKPLEVIPCCVDLRGDHRWSRPLPGVDGASQGAVLVYAGKLGGWYPTRAMADFFVAAREVIPGLIWRVLSQSNPAELQSILADRGLDAAVSIGRVSPDELPEELSASRAGLCLYTRKLSGSACSPTKVAEYLAFGLPVVASAGIGDTDAVLTHGLLEGPTADAGVPVGVLLGEMTDEGYRGAAVALRRLVDDPDTPRRCREVAKRLFDLETVGWERYRRLYEGLLGRPDPAPNADPGSTEADGQETGIGRRVELSG